MMEAWLLAGVRVHNHRLPQFLRVDTVLAAVAATTTAAEEEEAAGHVRRYCIYF